MDDVDEFCKKHSISSYVYVKASSTLHASQIFTTYANSAYTNTNDQNNSIKNNQSCSEGLDGLSCNSNLISNNVSSNVNSNSNLINYSYIKIKSFAEKSCKYLERKFNLSEFLANTNIVINNLSSSFNSINFNPTQQNVFFNSNFSTNAQNTPVLQSASYMNSASGTSLNNLSTNNQSSFSSYLDFIDSRLSSVQPSSISFASTPIAIQNGNASASSSSTGYNIMSQLNITLLLEPSSKPQSIAGSTRKKLESQVVSKISHVLALFNTRIRIELIVIETPENVIQALANGLHLEMDEQLFNSNWAQCMEKINNLKYKKQLSNFKLDEIIRESRYFKKSKVFILYSLKSEQFKLLVAP
jgi:hypothetical protein